MRACTQVRIGNGGGFGFLERSDRLPEAWAKAGLTFDNFLDWFSQSNGWHHTEHGDVQVLGKMSNSVHILMRYTRYRKDGSEIGRYQTVRVLCKSDRRWGVRARATVTLDSESPSGSRRTEQKQRTDVLSVGKIKNEQTSTHHRRGSSVVSEVAEHSVSRFGWNPLGQKTETNELSFGNQLLR